MARTMEQITLESKGPAHFETTNFLDAFRRSIDGGSNDDEFAFSQL